MRENWQIHFLFFLFPVEKGVLDQSSENQQVIERCYPLPPQNTLMLSELPEPPIPLSEIGPIPPPPMFSSSSPTLLLAKQRQIRNPLSSDYEDEGAWISWKLFDLLWQRSNMREISLNWIKPCLLAFCNNSEIESDLTIYLHIPCKILGDRKIDRCAEIYL